MVSIAYKNLVKEKGRFIASILGVAFSVFLMVVLIGLYNGWAESMTAYIKKIDADLWVTREGSADMFHTVSLLPNSSAAKIEAIPGVKSADSYLGRITTFDLKGEKANLYIVGFDPAKDVTKPQNIVEGTANPKPGEIIVDKSFMKNKGLKIGDTLTITGMKFKIAGVSTGSDMIVFQIGFINIAEAEKLFEMPNLSNYFLVRTDPGKEAEVAKAIKTALPATDTKTSAQFVKVNERFVSELFLPIIAVLVVIAFLIGTLFTGITIYTLTTEKIKEYGVLKAIGASSGRLFRIVMAQSLVSGVIGMILGIGLGMLVSRVAVRMVAMFYVVLRPQHLIIIGVLVILMIILASYIPIRKISKIDPVNIFKA